MYLMTFMMKNSYVGLYIENMRETSPIMRHATIFYSAQFFASFQENPFWKIAAPG